MLQKIKNPKKRIRISLLLIYDVLAILIAEYMALLIRYEFHPQYIKPIYLESVAHYTVINVIVTILIFAVNSIFEEAFRFSKENV